MRLVERHIIKHGHKFYKELDDLAWRSKNLYNYSNYIVRQAFINEHRYLNNIDVFHLVKTHETYKALPAKVSNQVLIMLHRNWKAFFAANRSYNNDPSKFKGRPRLPNYKDINKGRFALVYEAKAVSKRFLKRGLLNPSQTGIELPTKLENILELRVIPRCGEYVIEAVYEQEPQVNPDLDFTMAAAIDLGVDNLACITSNKRGFQPLLINGKVIKSINQEFNKYKAFFQSKLPKNKKSSNRIQKLTAKRNHRIDTYLHRASRMIIDRLSSEGIGLLIIGDNPLWKQEVNLGSTNNQNFVSIPYSRFIEMLRYKAELVGINVVVSEESYTSRASFLDLDPIPTYMPGVRNTQRFSGERVRRAWYRASGGRMIHADVNGSYNILRKVFPDAFAEGIGGIAVCPVRISF